MGLKDKAVITLTPLDFVDNYPRRVLTITPESPYMHIGRSSKTENKSLTANQHNAWFDSPVMSRDHARFYITPPASQFVFLKDVGSTHGTFVNSVRLVNNSGRALKNADTITFGSTVTRADETFYAREFRINYEWEESSPVPNSTHSMHPQAIFNKDKPLCNAQGKQPPTVEDDNISKPENGGLRTLNMSRSCFNVPDSDSDSSYSESDMDDSEPERLRQSSHVSSGSSAGISEPSKFPRSCLDGARADLVDIEIESRSAGSGRPLSNNSRSSSPQRRTFLASVYKKNEKLAGSLTNPMVINDEANMSEKGQTHSDDEGLQARHVGTKYVSPRETDQLGQYSVKSYSEESHFDDHSDSGNAADEVDSCKSVMGDYTDDETSERRFPFASDYATDGEETDDEQEQTYKHAYPVITNTPLLVRQDHLKYAQTEEGSDFSLMGDDDTHESESDGEPVSGDETEPELMSTDGPDQIEVHEDRTQLNIAMPTSISSRENVLGTSKSEIVLVEDSQAQTYCSNLNVVPPLAASNVIGRGISSAFPQASEYAHDRAPSPSDAAMAKPVIAPAVLPNSLPNCIYPQRMSSVVPPPVTSIDSNQMLFPKHPSRTTENFTKSISFYEPPMLDTSQSALDAYAFDDTSNTQKYLSHVLKASSHGGYLDGPFASESYPTKASPIQSGTQGLNELAFDPATHQTTYNPSSSFWRGNLQYQSNPSRTHDFTNSHNTQSGGNNHWLANPRNQRYGPSRPESSSIYYGDISAEPCGTKRSFYQDFTQHVSCHRPADSTPKESLPTRVSTTADEQPLSLHYLLEKPVSKSVDGKDIDTNAICSSSVSAETTSKGVSISDIVEPSISLNSDLSVAGSKRKANDISSTIDDEQLWERTEKWPSSSPTDDAVLHDAQPREFEVPVSQLSIPEPTSLKDHDLVRPRSEESHVSKKARTATSTHSNIMKYAATAVASAVLGGVGVFATLISLPEDI